MTERGKNLKRKIKVSQEINDLKKIQFDANGSKANDIYNLIQKRKFQHKVLGAILKNE